MRGCCLSLSWVSVFVFQLSLPSLGDLLFAIPLKVEYVNFWGKDLKVHLLFHNIYIGFLFFILGQSSNLYHHILLSKLRSGDTKEYKIPEGGLFSLVNCPHYLSEIIAWIGIAIMSKYLIVYGLVFIMSSYLFARSINTSRWYQEKIPNFPTNRKSILPFLL